jgi:hypothetical protein
LLEQGRLAGKKLLFALLLLNLPQLLAVHVADKGIGFGLSRLVLLLQKLSRAGRRLGRHGKDGQKAKRNAGRKQNFHILNLGMPHAGNKAAPTRFQGFNSSLTTSTDCVAFR